MKVPSIPSPDPARTVPQPPPRGKARATYEALSAAAERILETEGLPGLNSTAVAAEAGVATGTFYTYFSDKDALLAALFARHLDDISAAVEAVLTAEALRDDGLEATLRRAVGAVSAGYRVHSTVIRAALGRIPDSRLLRDVYWLRHERAAAVVEAFLRRGAALGLVRDGATQSLSLAMLVVVQGLNHPVLLAGEPRRVRAVSEHLVHALVGMLAPERATV